MSGGVASGKSTLAQALAERLGVPRIEADHVRKELLDARSPLAREWGKAADAGTRVVEEHEAQWQQSFEPGFEDRVYAELMRCAEVSLVAGNGLVLDACFPSRWWRGVARALAKRHGLPFLLVECQVDRETRRRRLAQRDTSSARGAGWEVIADRFARRYEGVEEFPSDEHVVVDTAHALATALAAVEAELPLIIGTPRSVPRLLDGTLAAVSFDCWNTLLYENDWALAHAHRVDAIAHALAGKWHPIARVDAENAFDAAWARHMDQWRVGIASGARDVAYDVLTTLGVPAEVESLDDLVREYQNASHSSEVLALEGAGESLEALAQAGVRCALVCDTGLTPGRVVRLHLSRLGLLDHLEVQIFSDEQGVPKPDARVFRAALEPLGVSPDRAVHVGDLRRTDVAGARAVGMATARIRASHDDLTPLPEADLVVDDHGDLRASLLGDSR